jgi:peptide/nickel transport system ATP-binding protein
MSPEIIKISDIVKTFFISSGAFREKYSLNAVNGVNLRINRGEVLALVGESGCGKTTLAKIILGLEQASSGIVEIEGKLIDSLSRLEVARILQPIFQDPYSSLNPRKNIGSIITLPLLVQGDANPNTWRRRGEEIMELVGLSRHLYMNYPNQLSGGQRQRVAIARALINRPSVVICDEPTSALDVSVQSQILNLLQDLRSELNLTYIIISHNLAVVEHLATKVAVMYLGRIVEEAETQKLFREPKHPYTQALLASVLTPDPNLSIPDPDLGASYPNPLNPPLGCSFHPRCSSILQDCDKLVPKPVMIDNGKVECHLFEE